MVGPDSSVDIAIRYGLDGPKTDSRWERVFQQQSGHSLGYNQFSIQWVLDYYWV